MIKSVLHTVSIDGEKYEFLLSPWVTKCYNKDNPQAPFDLYREDPVNTVLDIAFISFREANDKQANIKERDFYSIYAALDKDKKEELKEALVDNFLDLDREKTRVATIKLMLDKCTPEEVQEVKEFISNPQKEGN